VVSEDNQFKNRFQFIIDRIVDIKRK